jgi:regulator of protease activity HflC (stomatin/prohibitin superfamily)
MASLLHAALLLAPTASALSYDPLRGTELMSDFYVKLWWPAFLGSVALVIFFRMFVLVVREREAVVLKRLSLSKSDGTRVALNRVISEPGLHFVNACKEWPMTYCWIPPIGASKRAVSARVGVDDVKTRVAPRKGTHLSLRLGCFPLKAVTVRKSDRCVRIFTYAMWRVSDPARALGLSNKRFVVKNLPGKGAPSPFEVLDATLPTIVRRAVSDARLSDIYAATPVNKALTRAARALPAINEAGIEVERLDICSVEIVSAEAAEREATDNGAAEEKKED